jgi:hypothetical protein
MYSLIICALLIDVAKTVDMASNYDMVSEELKCVEPMMAQLDVLSRILPGGTKERHGTRCKYSFCCPKPQPMISRIRNKNAKHTTATFFVYPDLSPNSDIQD